MTAEDFLKALAQFVNAGRFGEAADLAARANDQFPDDERISRARAIILRRADRPDEAESYLLQVLRGRPNAAWAHAQIGLIYQYKDHAQAISHFRHAHRLDPGARDYRLSLVQALAKQGGGELLEEAYQLLRPVLSAANQWPQNDLHVAFDVLSRVCAFDDLDLLGEPMELGRKWAEAGNHAALFMLLGHTACSEQRQALVDLHSVAVRNMEAAARANPLYSSDEIPQGERDTLH